MRLGKPLVVFPRLKRFGELHNDHQRELAEALGNQGRTVVVNDPCAAKLRSAIDQASQLMLVQGGATGLVLALRCQLDAWV